MIEWTLNPLKDNAYKKVEEAIHDYMFVVGNINTFIVRIAVGKTSKVASHTNEVVYKENNEIVFLDDWWEGEPYVAVLGIIPVTDVTDFDDIKMEE